MAASYSEVTKSNYTANYDEQADDPNTVKPIFVKDIDIFGSVVPTKEMFVTHVEIYKAIGAVVDPSTIKGIQCIRRMWRIYMDNQAGRMTLLTQGIVLRGKSINIHTHNPANPMTVSSLIMKVRVKGVALSADDGIIKRALELKGITVEYLTREHLRVDGKLTNCENGDRVALCKTFEEPLPKFIKMSKYNAIVLHPGQPSENYTHTQLKTCNKCFETGHMVRECPNEWKCKRCHSSGHKQIDCPEGLSPEMFSDNEDNDCHDIEHNTSDGENENENDENSDTQGDENEVQHEGSGQQIEQTKSQKQAELKGQQSKGQSLGHFDKTPKQQQNKKSEKNKNTKKTEKSVSFAKSQSTMKSFVKTPNSQLRNKQQHTPPTPEERDRGKKPNKG